MIALHCSVAKIGTIYIQGVPFFWNQSFNTIVFHYRRNGSKMKKLSGFKNRNRQGTKLIESSLTRNYFNLNFGHFQVGNWDGTPCKSNFLSKEVLAAVCQQWWNWVEVPSHVYLLLLWKTWIKQKKSRVNSNGFENNARGICKFLRPISISPESRWRAAPL